MGARDLYDVLRRIPSVEIQEDANGRNQITTRGLFSPNSEQIKLLIDGHSVNTLYDSGFSKTFGRLSLDNVRQIEIIRGPGGAIYGTNAFSMVINVVTKSGQETKRFSALAGGGTFNAKKGNLQTGKVWSDGNLAFAIDYRKRGDTDRLIAKDAGNASGIATDHMDFTDATLKIKQGNVSLNTRVVSQSRGTTVGVGSWLNDESKVDTTEGFIELGYTNDVTESSTATVKTHYGHNENDFFFEIYPETYLPLFFPDGVLGNVFSKERVLGIDAQLDTQVNSQHMTTVGISYQHSKQYDVRAKANYNPLTGFPLGSMQEVTGYANWNKNESRQIKAVFLQNIWTINPEVEVTAGVRHDQYSDFGNSTNPRAALVWRLDDNWDTKLLYATAFRAPSYQDLYTASNTAIIGDPNLKAEKMKTTEISLGYHLPSQMDAQLTLFSNRFSNQITLITGPTGVADLISANQGGAKVEGVEAEMRWRFDSANSVYASYTQQQAKDTLTGKQLGDTAKNLAKLGFNTSAGSYLNFNANLFATGKRPRHAGDTRAAHGGYALIDVAAIAKGFYRDMELRASVHNLLNRKYDYALQNTQSMIDAPGVKRSVNIDLLYQF